MVDLHSSGANFAFYRRGRIRFILVASRGGRVGTLRCGAEPVISIKECRATDLFGLSRDVRHLVRRRPFAKMLCPASAGHAIPLDRKSVGARNALLGRLDTGSIR